MTNTKTLLALALSCFVASACSGEQRHEQPAANEQLRAPKEQPRPAPELLTATAPGEPASLLDGKGSAQSARLGDDAPKKKPQDEPSLELAALELGHDVEPEAPVDFDRPLSAAEVKVERFVLATGVTGREPTGTSDSFDEDTKKIFAFVELANETEPYAIEVHFEKLGGPKSRYGVKLDVGKAARFRTWAWTQIRREPGEYRAVLRTPAGEDIASHDFVITEAAHD
jgi:hypothetical protein